MPSEFDPLTAPDGIYPGVSRAHYGRIPAINHSLLKFFNKTPAHAKDELDNRGASTDAMIFGNRFHVAVLEPERFEREFTVAPKFDKRFKDQKAAWNDYQAASADKEIVEADDMQTILAMQKSCYKHPFIRKLMEAPGKNEVCIIWTDIPTGLRCKALIDRIVRLDGITYVLDYKTCMDAGDGFSRECGRLLYHVQASYYMHGLNTLAKAERKWLWIPVEKKKPYLPAIRFPDDDTRATGFAMAMGFLRQYKLCTESGSWPGYPDEATELRISRWDMLGGADNDE